MKLYKLSLLALTGAMMVACSDIDDTYPEGGSLLADQSKETNLAIPERTNATFSGMFTMMGQPNYTFKRKSPRADDFGFVMMCISNDAEGADLWLPDNNYNWFSVCGEWSSRNADYANPYVRYASPYNQIAIANEVLSSFPADTDDADAINKMAQARAIRAYDYLWLAPFFQFNYADNKDLPCVPLVTPETTDYSNNPRASVKEVYELIISDLDYAIEHLGSDRASKMYINQAVAYGLRARAYLNMGEYAKAAEDADKAISLSGATPASIEDVSKPSFCNIEDNNWMWGYDMTTDLQQIEPYATCDSWLGSFSAWGYTAGAGCYAHVNSLLYNKIPSTDVRKGWWINENLHSPLLADVEWDGAKGDEIVTLTIPDVKEPMDAYTNVKFGMASGIGSETNNSDYPFMRVEEMYLIKAEGLAKSGNEAQAKQVLSNFVKTYRDPGYDLDKIISSGLRNLSDEIWFQRRVELWGEGFGMSDIMRLKKPVVRFHSLDDPYPAAFRYNVEYGDPYMLLRFPKTETNNNAAIENNTGGQQPVSGQNPNLRDGVTD